MFCVGSGCVAHMHKHATVIIYVFDTYRNYKLSYCMNIYGIYIVRYTDYTSKTSPNFSNRFYAKAILGRLRSLNRSSLVRCYRPRSCSNFCQSYVELNVPTSRYTWPFYEKNMKKHAILQCFLILKQCFPYLSD